VEAEELYAPPLRLLVAGSLAGEIAHLETVLRRIGYDPAWEIVGEPPQWTETPSVDPCSLFIADGDSASFDCHRMVRTVRDGRFDIPLLVLSSDRSEERAVAAIRAGVDEWVEKPCIEEQLPAAIDRAVVAAGQRRAARRAAEEETAQAEIAQALADVALELVAAWDTRMLFERLGQVSVSVLKCDSCSTLMVEEGGDAFELVASYGWTVEEQAISPFVRAPRDVMAPMLERLACQDVVELKTTAMASVVPTPHAQLSHLFTALTREGAVIGIQVFSRRSGAEPFTPTQYRIAAGIAELASLSLAHAQVIDELERVHRVKSDFVATVSHELRTPLHIVMGYTDLLIDGAFGTLTDEQIQPLQRIRQRGRGLLELINATLDLNRLEAGRIGLDVEPIDLSELMTTLHRETRESQNSPNVRLVWDVPETLPVVSTDAAKLKVALKNLIANALKFTDQGSVAVRVSVDQNEVEFSVADSGVGIAPESLPIVFEAFRQADSSSTRRFGGVGLGLYIVRRLLDMLGGRVEVESELGRGSTFRIHLPRSIPAG
jgi:signal transduction histidine kinase